MPASKGRKPARDPLPNARPDLSAAVLSEQNHLFDRNDLVYLQPVEVYLRRQGLPVVGAPVIVDGVVTRWPELTFF